MISISLSICSIMFLFVYHDLYFSGLCVYHDFYPSPLYLSPPFISLSLYLSSHISIYLSIYPYNYLSTPITIYLSNHISIQGFYRIIFSENYAKSVRSLGFNINNTSGAPHKQRGGWTIQLNNMLVRNRNLLISFSVVYFFNNPRCRSGSIILI